MGVLWSRSLVVWPNWEWVVWKGGPRRELSNTPKNIEFRQADQKLWSFEIASVHYGFWFVFDNFLWQFSNNINFSDKWKFPWRKLLKIGRSVLGESIYNLVETNCVFVERFMCYIRFCGDGFFCLCIPSAEVLLDF